MENRELSLQVTSQSETPNAAESVSAVVDSELNPTETLPPEKMLQVLESQRADLEAEFERFRKQSARLQELFHYQAKRDFLNDLLPVLDELTFLLRNAEASGNTQATLDGARMTLQRFGRFLSVDAVDEVVKDVSVTEPNQADEPAKSKKLPESGPSLPNLDAGKRSATENGKEPTIAFRNFDLDPAPSHSEPIPAEAREILTIPPTREDNDLPPAQSNVQVNIFYIMMAMLWGIIFFLIFQLWGA